MIIGIDTRSSNWYRGTGIGTYSCELIRSLLEIDKANYYNLYTPKSCLKENQSHKNISYKALEQEKCNNFWHSVNNTEYTLDSTEDIFHTHQNGVGMPKDKSCKFVITLHDLIPLKMPETVSDAYMEIFNDKMPEIISNCDGIITVSNHSKRDIIDCYGFPEDKIFVTYLASDSMYKPISKTLSKSIIRNIYGLEGNLILYIGGFSPRKNILGLIDAFSKLNEIDSKYTLVIAGMKGKSYEIYQKRVDELNLNSKVVFPGYIELEHLPYMYSASDLFVYPSFYEGFGLPPIEAMSCGVPVIASNVTSIPEIVENGALFIDPYDVEDMFKKLKYVLHNKDLSKDLIERGFIRAKKLSWKDTAKKTLEAYEKINSQP